MYQEPGGYHGYNSMNHTINQFNDMNISGRGGGGSGNRRPRFQRPDFRRDDRRRRHSDEEDNQSSFYRGGYRMGRFQPGRGGGYMARGRNPMGDFQPHFMRRGGEQYGGGWRNAPMERDDYFPIQLSTHSVDSVERYQKDWSKLRNRNPDLESKLFKKQHTKINFDNWKNIPVETSGTNLPEPISSFKDILLGEILDNNLEMSGITEPTPVQMYSTSIVKQGRDLMACAQTGSGKTAAFLVPILSNLFENGPPLPLKDGSYDGHKVVPLVLILAPTRELASQIFEMTQRLCYRSCVRPYVVYGGSNLEKCIEHLSMGVEVLVATPGRLIDLLNRHELSLEMVKFVVLDEADRMLDMGFEKDIRTIVTDFGMRKSPARQTLMFSATFPKPIQILAKEFMDDYVFLTVGRVGSTNEIIQQNVLYVRRSEKIPELIRVVSEEKKDRILVFVRTKVDTEKIQAVLKDQGFSAISIHGNKSQRMRENALSQFRNGDKNILVATEVAARGLDIPNISHVINFDMPDNVENYVHRIGRTGRMGNPGVATSFFCESDWHIASGLTDLLKESKQELPKFLSSNINNSGGGSKKSYSQERFGGRDYRRGPQYNTIRYSNSGPVRSYPPNNQPPNFYGHQIPAYGPISAYGASTPFIPLNAPFGPSFQTRDRGESSLQGGPNQAPAPGPPPTQQQNYLHNFAQMATSTDNVEVNQSPSTPGPIPMYPGPGSNAALFGNQYGSPSFSPRTYQASPGPPQALLSQQPDVNRPPDSSQTQGLMRPLLFAGGVPPPNLNLSGLPNGLWAAWQPDAGAGNQGL